jgi:hypothetical protein
MNSSLAPLGKPKVLDRIGDVHVLLRHSGFSQRILKQASSRSNKGNALPIFDIAGLLADQSQKTTWVAGFHSSQPLQSTAARLSSSMSACSGTHGAAVCTNPYCPSSIEPAQVPGSWSCCRPSSLITWMTALISAK